VDVELRLGFAVADFAVALEGLRQCSSLASVWAGEVYRSATPRYARTGDIVTGVGSAKMGGRWNPPGSFPTVYASLQPEAATSRETSFPGAGFESSDENLHAIFLDTGRKSG
jgi:RES domain-containing protein